MTTDQTPIIVRSIIAIHKFGSKSEYEDIMGVKIH